MDKAKIIITGSKVQEVGYRVYLLTNALNFGINKFYAYNTTIKNTQAVILLLEAEREIITDFYNYINENVPDDAIVSDFKIEDYNGNVMEIDKYLHLIQVEQLNKGIPAILDIRDNTKTMLEKQDSMLGKQDSMLEKQDSMLGKQDAMLGKQDTLIEITEKGFREVKEEIHEQRDEFKEIFMHEVSELRGEIAEVKATLARMQAAG